MNEFTIKITKDQLKMVKMLRKYYFDESNKYVSTTSLYQDIQDEEMFLNEWGDEAVMLCTFYPDESQVEPVFFDTDTAICMNTKTGDIYYVNCFE